MGKIESAISSGECGRGTGKEFEGKTLTVFLFDSSLSLA
jgi:hypothetical protein